MLIYEQMFPLDEVNVYAVKGSLHKAEDAHHTAGDHVRILATCRLFYTEGMPILYTNTDFHIHIRDEYWWPFFPSNSPDFYRIRDRGAISEPNPAEWLANTKWLQDPRSIVPLNNVRTLSLDIALSNSTAPHREDGHGQVG